MRARAESAGVSLRPEEQFGFSAYAHEGPAPGLIAAIQRQKRAAECVLEALFAAHPRQLLSVQRAPAAGSGPTSPPPGPVGDADTLEVDPRLLLKEPGVEQTAAFRLTFTGYTATLRQFLNRLAACDRLMVVRGVAVEPAVPNSPSRTAPSPGPESLLPAVRPALSRFAVTVESCELAERPSSAGGDRPAASGVAGFNEGTRRWAEPAAQRRGPGWVYDVFTPPAVNYDPRRRTLTANPAPELGPADADEVPLDLDLMEIRREPFRLQLIGYAGGPADLRGIFLDVRTGETVIGHPGDHLPGCGLTVTQLAVTRGGGGCGEDAETGEPIAMATVADDATGGEVALTSRGRSWSGKLLALVASRRTRGFRRELREGESIELDGASYCVKRIDQDPPLVVIAGPAAAGAGSAVHALRPAHAPAATGVVPALGATARSIPGLSRPP